jgi:hypothetical protein
MALAALGAGAIATLGAAVVTAAGATRYPRSATPAPPNTTPATANAASVEAPDLFGFETLEADNSAATGAAVCGDTPSAGVSA